MTKRGLCVCSVAQSCPAICDPMDYSPPGSSVHGILKARVLEWASIPFSRGSSQPRVELGSPALQVDSLPSEPPGKNKKLLREGKQEISEGRETRNSIYLDYSSGYISVYICQTFIPILSERENVYVCLHFLDLPFWHMEIF